MSDEEKKSGKKLKSTDKKKVAEGQDFGIADALVVRSQSSVTLKKDAKDNVAWEIKSYHDNPTEAAKNAIVVDGNLRKEYGLEIPEGETND